ncbi:hypothetical protein [Streptomyces sp. UNOC14_S4]|uniref:hypothetical protein n=1 Tax=Streptomyces sp. UNOC14_S4 TaxID=2872340 RepID=UPI001E58DCD8|nr:hypothetical protein [Streptomyces sp. UNOC14_S4]
MTSFTTLALGTSAGTLLWTVIIGILMAALGMYTLSHQRRVFAWTQWMRERDEGNVELDRLREWIDNLYEAQCALAQKPCHAGDFAEVVRITHMIKGVADHSEVLRSELTRLVERAESWISTALPELDPDAKVPAAEHRAQLVRAMKQEAARVELVRAVLAAQGEINSLRRG